MRKEKSDRNGKIGQEKIGNEKIGNEKNHLTCEKFSNQTSHQIKLCYSTLFPRIS